jgi:hypothetical protein
MQKEPWFRRQAMRAIEYLQFLALMIPTVLVLVLAAFSLASTSEALGAERAVPAPVLLPAAVDAAGRQTAY